MYSGWTYAQCFRAIGQSLEELTVKEFSIAWREDGFVVTCQRPVRFAQSWLARLLDQPPRLVMEPAEIFYSNKRILWLQIQGESLRQTPNQTPDYFRLSQSLRTVGGYIDKMTLAFSRLQCVGGNFVIEFLERGGKKRVEEHGIGSFENYFRHTYLRARRNP